MIEAMKEPEDNLSTHPETFMHDKKYKGYDDELLKRLMAGAEVSSPEAKRLIAAGDNLMTRDIVKQSYELFLGDVKPNRPVIPEVIDVADIDSLRTQQDLFTKSVTIYIEGLPTSSVPKEKVLQNLQNALNDDSERPRALEMISRDSSIDSGELALMIRGDLSDALWEAVIAGREAILSLLHQEQDYITRNLVGQWRKELDQAVKVTEDNFKRIIEYLENNK